MKRLARVFFLALSIAAAWGAIAALSHPAFADCDTDACADHGSAPNNGP